MGYLWDIAQRHLDAYGVRAAALARRMGTSPQTLDSWKNRGVRSLPSKSLLEALARETRTPYGDVLTAALRDIDYLPRDREHGVHTAPTKPAASAAAEQIVEVEAEVITLDQAQTPAEGQMPPPERGSQDQR